MLLSYTNINKSNVTVEVKEVFRITTGIMPNSIKGCLLIGVVHHSGVSDTLKAELGNILIRESKV